MITVTHLYTARSNTDANSYVTPSNLSPSANKLVIGVISNKVTSGTAGVPALTGGGVSTWDTYTDETRGTDTVRLSILYGRTGSSPTASQVTISFAGATQGNCEWSFFELDGAIDTGINGADAFIGNTWFATSVNTNTQSLTLPTFSGANSVAIGAYYIASSRTATAISPSTFLGTTTGASEAATLTTVYSTDETTGVEFTGTNAGWLSIAVEIGAASDVVLPIVQLTPFRTRGINGRFN